MSVTPRTRKRVALISLWAMILASASADAEAQSAEQPAAARIAQRLVRVSRDRSGALVVLEVLQVKVGTEPSAGDSLEMLPLLQLPSTASQAQLVGGDLASSRLTELDGGVGVRGPFPARSFQLGISYTLPASAESIDLSTRLPVDTLVVDVARGSVEARPDAALRRVASVDAGARPRIRYRVENLASGRVVRLRLDRSTVDWRHRFAVLMATALAAVVAGFWVWRGAAPMVDRGRSEPPRAL